MKETLKRLLESWQLPAEPLTLELFEAYCALLLERNREMNLIGEASPNEIAARHFLDSLAPLMAAKIPQGASLIDVGSGAGFPGLPLKIFRPDLRVTLLDSQTKRIEFLAETIRKLKMENIFALNARAEEAASSPENRESFDFATSRAVAKMSALCELCLPFVKLGGEFLAMKSRKSLEEQDEAARAVAKLGGVFLPRFDYNLPPEGAELCVVRVKKSSPTPQNYPRSWAKIKKAPL